MVSNDWLAGLSVTSCGGPEPDDEFDYRHARTVLEETGIEALNDTQRVDVKSLIIDGVPYYYAQGDLYLQEHQILDAMRERLGQPEGSLDLSSTQAPFPTIISAEQWRSSITHIAVRLDEIQSLSYYVDDDAYAHRMPEAILETMKPYLPLKPQARSTISHGRDDGHSQTRLGIEYAIVYGANPREIQPIRSALFKPEICKRPLFDIHQRKSNGSIQRVVLTRPNPSNGYPEVVPWKALTFCSSLPIENPAPEIMGALRAYVRANQKTIDDALAIVSKHHPAIHPENLRLAFYQNLSIEFHVFDDTDVLQDLSASLYAGAEYHEALAERLVTGPKTWFAATWAGVKLWLAYSDYEDVPIETQGFGPLQIIPELAMAAYQNLKARGYFEEYVGDGKLSHNNLTSYESIMAASFHPSRGIYIKAMVWDLQLSEVEKLKGFAVPYLNPPHIQSTEAASELALLESAAELVEQPDSADLIHIPYLFADYSPSLAEFYQMGEIFGVDPQFDGIVATQTPHGTSHAFAWFERPLSDGKTYLYSK